MFLHTIATAVPPYCLSQEECWAIARNSPKVQSLTHRSQLVLRTVLTRDTSIAQRHFAHQDLAGIFDQDADQLNAAFRQEGPKLATSALQRALAKTGIAATEIDALLVCTCTGYLCPGLTSYIAESMGLRANAYLQDLVGLGCGAAIPMWRAANALLAVDPAATIACVAVEISSAAFYLDDDQGVLISACIFSDGAAATIWRAIPPENQPVLRLHAFDTVNQPEWRDHIRFDQKEGKLRNMLRSDVPQLAANAVRILYDRATAADQNHPITKVISHTGGREVLDAIEQRLPGFKLTESRKVLRDYANMSSPSVIFALAEALANERIPSGKDWWLTAFGAGFSAHSCRLSADQ